MHTAITSSSTTAWSPQRASPPQAVATDIARRPSTAMSADAPGGYDPILLVASLEEIEARRATLEWLLDANLLCLCLA